MVKCKIFKNDARIKELNEKQDKMIDLLSTVSSEDKTLESPTSKFVISKLDKAYSEKRALSKESYNFWKWKIGTLASLSGTLLTALTICEKF